MIVFDAVVLIAYLDSKDVHHARAEQVLVQEIDDDFGVNSLTLAEVLVGPARANRLEVVVDALRDLEVRELAFPDDAAAKLAHLRADTNLKMPDCCVLLAAAEAGARIASFDDRLRAAATARGLVLVPGEAGHAHVEAPDTHPADVLAISEIPNTFPDESKDRPCGL